LFNSVAVFRLGKIESEGMISENFSGMIFVEQTETDSDPDMDEDQLKRKKRLLKEVEHTRYVHSLEISHCIRRVLASMETKSNISDGAYYPPLVSPDISLKRYSPGITCNAIPLISQTRKNRELHLPSRSIFSIPDHQKKGDF
jgi:hypothetical protein